MRVGGLNQTIKIKHRVVTGVSGNNDPVYEFRVLREVFAGVLSRRGTEHFDANAKQRYSESITRFTVHYGEYLGITPDMVIEYEGRNYDIRVILPDHERKDTCIIDAALQGFGGEGPPAIFGEPPTNGVVGQVYRAFFTIVGGAAPVSLSLDLGSPPEQLPAGLSLVAVQSGLWSIEGVPTEQGSFPVTVTVTDANGRSAALSTFTLVIAPAS